MKIARICNHTFLSNLLSSGDIVIDAGAHRGEFSEHIHRLANVTVYGFEANPELFSKLQSSQKIEYIDMAVASQIGEILFQKGEAEAGSIVFRKNSGDVVTVTSTTLDSFCQTRNIDTISLLKLDIEGAELEVLESISLDLISRIGQITVEFHDFVNPEDLPRIKSVVAHLQKSGFYFIRLSAHTWGDCLFINTRALKLSVLARIKLHMSAKYFPGLLRIIKKYWK